MSFDHPFLAGHARLFFFGAKAQRPDFLRRLFPMVLGNTQSLHLTETSNLTRLFYFSPF